MKPTFFLNTSYSILLLFIVAFTSCTEKHEPLSTETTIKNPTNKAVPSGRIVWEMLNPARGDKSPQAGTVWGDRKGEVATGFLAKFVDGFSSPPHIHNVTYRAVVIKGLVHNDDAEAENMWMSAGSFWTQPAGAAHITSAKGEENIAYVEIDKGPYLVKPTDEAFDQGEKPVNIDASNVIWLGSDKTSWVSKGSEAELSFLWESKSQEGLKGMFVKLPFVFNGKITSSGDEFHAVVIQGEMAYTLPQAAESITLDPGSYFTSTSRAEHSIRNKSTSDLLVYVRTNGEIMVSEVK